MSAVAMAVATEERMLPCELWTIIVLDVEPRWRFLLRRVCRRWREYVDRADPCIVGFCQNTLYSTPVVPSWEHRWQTKWARGRIVCASVLCDWICARRDLWSDAVRAITWIDAYVGDVRHRDLAVVMVATCVPMLVEHVMTVVLPTLVDLDARSSDPKRFWPFMQHYTMINDPIYTVGAAAVRTGSLAVIDAVAASIPFALTSSLAIGQALCNDDVDAFERITAIVPMGDCYVPGADLAPGPRVLAHSLEAADDPRGRDWAEAVAAFLSDHDNVEHAFGCAIEAGKTLCLDLWASRLAHIDVDHAVERACRESSVDSVRWLLDRERALPDGNVERVTKKIMLASVSGMGAHRVCPKRPEALIAWLCDGPLAFDPTAADTAPDMSLEALFTAAVGSDGDPRCAAWLMERWPRECGSLSPALVAQVVPCAIRFAQNCFNRINVLERAIVALEAVTWCVTSQRATALVDAVDVWSALWDTMANPRGLGQYVQDDIMGAYTRWADGDAHAEVSLDDCLAGIRAQARHDGHFYGRPGDHLVHVDTAAWRRWCRVRPMRASTYTWRATYWTKKDRSTAAWLARRGLLLEDGDAVV